MNPEVRGEVHPSNEELQEENQALRRELGNLKARRQSFWPVLVEISRRLLLSSTSIKAAVSSLLNYDIFWDGANQHEFLQTINTSSDQLAQLAKLLALSFRSEAGSLEVKREPQMLQEIISIVQDWSRTNLPSLSLEVTLPKEGKPVLVDYEYLTMAVKLILEAMPAPTGLRPVHVRAIENTENWFLDFDGLAPSVVELARRLPDYYSQELGGVGLSVESILRLDLSYQILRLQGIQLTTFDAPGGTSVLRLCVPTL